MKFSGRIGWSLLCLAVCLLGSRMVLAAEPTFRDLVRKYLVTKQEGGEVAALPGLTGDAHHVVALEYTVLLRKPDGDEPVDVNTHNFDVGDQIRVRIKPESDLYIYIFHEGASGERTCLLPDKKEMPPLAKAQESLDLPADGSVFEFSPPAGDEKLIVVATEKPSEDLAVMADVVFKKPNEELTKEEQEVQKKLKARSQKILKSIRERQAQGTQYRGLFSSDALTKVRQEISKKGATRAVLEEPPHDGETSTFSMSVSFRENEAPQHFVTIPLKSTPIGDAKK